VTVWLAPRLVAPVAKDGVDAQAIVTSSDHGWGETDVAGVLRAGDHPAASAKDVPGPAPIAVASTSGDARLVVIGSATTFTTAVIERKIAVNDALFASAVAWLTGRTKLAGVGAKTPEQFRVIMTPAQVKRVFVVCVVLIPGLAGAVGAFVAWRRRREGARA
jgi:hypothetical protein